MKKLSLLTSLLAVGGALSASAQSTPTITVVPTMAPNAYGSPSIDAWTQNAITGIEDGQTTVGAPGPTQYNAASGPLPNAYNNVTSYSSWLGQANPPGAYAGEYGNRATFDVLVNGNGSKIDLADLAFNSVSSDPNNNLGFGFGPGIPNPYFGPFTDYDSQDIGLIFNQDGSTTVVNSGDASQLVDEIISVSAGDAYWPVSATSSPADEQAAIDESDAAVGSYTYTGSFYLDGASGSATFDFVPDSGGMSLNVVALGGLLGFGWMLKKKTLTA
jgi:hypothetical protein